MEDLFNVNATVISPDDIGGNNGPQNEFRPSPKKGIGGVFDGVLRFIVNPRDPSAGSLVQKYSILLKNDLTGERKEVDCPSTVGAPDLLQSTFFELRNSDNPVLKENSKKYSRKLRFASLVQVLDCKSAPELVGKILVWRFGQKIYEKINNELQPANAMAKASNPFNLLSGRPMYFKVIESAGFPNYDQCNFFSSENPEATAVVCPVVGADGNIQRIPVTEKNLQNVQFKETVTKWLNETAPDLEPYKYHEWDEATKKFVLDCIKIDTNPQASMNAAKMAASGGVAAAGKPAGIPSFDPASLNMGPVPGAAAPVAASIPGVQAAPQAAPANLGDVLNTNPIPSAPQKQAAPAPAPGGGLSLGDVLGDIL